MVRSVVKELDGGQGVILTIAATAVGRVVRHTLESIRNGGHAIVKELHPRTCSWVADCVDWSRMIWLSVEFTGLRAQ